MFLDSECDDSGECDVVSEASATNGALLVVSVARGAVWGEMNDTGSVGISAYDSSVLDTKCGRKGDVVSVDDDISAGIETEGESLK